MTETIKKTVKIAEAAGRAIMEVYNDPNFAIQIERKGDNSPLTLADKKSHEVIAAGLAENFPEIPVLSEEGRDIPFSERKNWTKFWCVDPLDGTKEFIKRNGEFAVHIALIENGEVILGVVHLPVLGTTYFAEKNGGGSFKIENGEVEKINCLQFSYSDVGLKLVASRSHLSAETADWIAQFIETQTVSMGSSMKFMLVADGRAHIYPRLGPTMEWDSAAPQIIVEEAGGSVTDFKTGLPLRYNKENLLNEWFLVQGNLRLE